MIIANFLEIATKYCSTVCPLCVPCILIVLFDLDYMHLAFIFILLYN